MNSLLAAPTAVAPQTRTPAFAKALIRKAFFLCFFLWSFCNSVPQVWAQSVPNAPSITQAIPGDKQVQLSWSSGAATSFRVKRSLASGGTYATITTVSSATYTDTGLTNGSTYSYIVTALNSVGESASSNPVSVTPLASAPPQVEAPTVTNITPVGFTVTAPAALPANTLYFRVETYEGAQSSGYYPPTSGWVTAGSSITAGSNYTLTQLKAGTAYQVRFVAVGSEQQTPGLVTGVTTATLTPPSAPTITNITPTDLTATAPATLPPYINSLTLQNIMGSESSYTWSNIASGLGAGAVTNVSGLTPNWNGYRFRYVGVSNASTINGNDVSVTTPASPAPTSPSAPGAPVSFSNITPNSVTVTAPALPPYASTLSLQQNYTPYGPPWTTVATGLPGGTATNVTGLTPQPSAAIYFRYVAVGAGSSTTGPYGSVTLPTLSAPAAPTFNSVLSTSLQVVMPALPSWMSSLTLQQSSSSSGPWNTIGSGLAGNAVVPITGLTPAYTYYFRCVAVGSYGNTTSATSQVQTAAPTNSSPPSAPSAPAFSSIAATTLTVTAPAMPLYATQMTLNQKLASAPDSAYVVIATLTQGGVATNVTGLSPQTAYSFVYIASNSYGSSVGYPGSVTTLPLAPATPQGLTAVPGNGQVQLSWTAVSGATGYKLKWSNTSGGPYTIISVGNGTSYTHSPTPPNYTPLTNGTTYYYVVSATNSAGESANSSEVSAIPSASITIPAAPALSNITPISMTVTTPGTFPANTSSFSIQQSTGFYSPGTWTTIATGLGLNVAFNVTGLTPSTKYYFRCVAVGTGGSIAGNYANATTLALPLPGNPTFGNILPTSIRVTAPALPQYADTLSLQKSTDGGSTYATIASGLAGGAQTDVTGLTPNTSSSPYIYAYYFRYLGVGAYGTATGNASGVNTASLVPPSAPSFGTITPISIDVISPALPTYSTSLTLQKKLTSDPDTAYTNVATNIGAQNVTTTASGLIAGTAYTFRYVGVGDQGSVNGASAGTSTQNLPAPVAPTFSNITTTTLTAILPTMPMYATSMNLQQKVSNQADTSYRTLQTGLLGGASVPVTGLTSSTNYSFRAVAVRETASTVGAAATVTTTLTVPQKPGLPMFSDISSIGVRVTAPILPPGTASFTLQKKLHGQADGTYVNVASNLGGGAVTDVGGLSPATAYTFRYQAVGPGGTTNGGGADVTTLDANIVWNAGSGINCAGIRFPWSGAVISRGTTGPLNAYLATDWDERVLTVDGDTTSGSYSDPCSYTWSANGGSFVGGVNTGQNVQWVAPTTPGTYTIGLVVDDQNNANMPNGESGSRDDYTLGYNDDPLSFSVTVTVQ